MERSREGEAVAGHQVPDHRVSTRRLQNDPAGSRDRRDCALERFLGDESAAIPALRRLFAGLYGLERDAPITLTELIEKVKKHPHGFVMKPQREGGGNNIYGDRVFEALSHMAREELEWHIIMERIQPSTQSITLLKDGQHVEV